MPSSVATIEATAVIGAGAAAVAYLAWSLLHGEMTHAVVGLAAYALVWIYGLYRAAYS